MKAARNRAFFLVFALAIVSMAAAFTVKPVFGPIRMLSVGLVVLILVQIVLGFITLGTGNSVVALLHFLNAMAIYGMTVAGTFMAMRWDRMAQLGAAAGPERA